MLGGFTRFEFREAFQSVPQQAGVVEREGTGERIQRMPASLGCVVSPGQRQRR